MAYGADYFTRLQNSDGSFPIKLVTDSTIVPGSPGVRCMNVDVGITARAVLALTAASRVLQGYNNALASRCLGAATNGWAWVKNNPTNYINDGTIYPSYWWSSADSVLGAAVELAVTTGAAGLTDATNYFYDGKFDGNGNWVKKTGSYIHQSSGEDAAIGLARYYGSLPPGSGLRADIAKQLTNYWAAMQGRINTPFGTDSGNFNSGFGGNSGYSTKAYILLNVYRALNSGPILTSARDYMNWLYGANPFGSAFIIGFGNLNVVPQFARPRPGSIGEIIPGIVTTTNSPLTTNVSLTTWGGSDYGVGEGGVADTSVLPAYMALMDNLVSVAASPQPTLGAVGQLGNGAVRFTYNGPAGRNYRLWAGTNPALGPVTNHWTLLGNGTFNSGPASFMDLNATNFPRRFYSITSP